MRRLVAPVALLLLAAALRAQETGGIQGKIRDGLLVKLPAAIYVDKIAGRVFEPPPSRPVIDQRNLVFVPHVLPILKGTTVQFKNSDDVKHNIFSSRKSPTVFNLGTYSAGTTRTVTFDKSGIITLLCNVHSEMSAFVVVAETPYFSVTDREGNFKIEGIPPGSYGVALWHEILRAPPQSVTVEKGKMTTVEWREVKRK